eukprot:1064414-Pyramimonas_sp.AAC.1
MFYNQGHEVFHAIDRCIRYGAGIEVPDETMTSILDAYHPCWILFGPAKVLYSDEDGALNNDIARAALTANTRHGG